jgi:uncharacterized membrane protein
MSDNISPPAYDGTQSEKNYVIAVHALYLASAVVGISAIIGLIMAYVKSDSAEPWAESHYQYAIGLGCCMASSALYCALF